MVFFMCFSWWFTMVESNKMTSQQKKKQAREEKNMFQLFIHTHFTGYFDEFPP